MVTVHDSFKGSRSAKRDDLPNDPLSISIKVPDWYAEALCAEVGPELFFAELVDEEGDDPGWTFEISEAKSICEKCPVVLACAAYALEENIKFGIWGGLTAPERLEIQQKLKIPKKRKTRVSVR